MPATGPGPASARYQLQVAPPASSRATSFKPRYQRQAALPASSRATSVKPRYQLQAALPASSRATSFKPRCQLQAALPASSRETCFKQLRIHMGSILAGRSTGFTSPARPPHLASQPVRGRLLRLRPRLLLQLPTRLWLRLSLRLWLRLMLGGEPVATMQARCKEAADCLRFDGGAERMQRSQEACTHRGGKADEKKRQVAAAISFRLNPFARRGTTLPASLGPLPPALLLCLVAEPNPPATTLPEPSRYHASSSAWPDAAWIGLGHVLRNLVSSAPPPSPLT
jgi:hypothetical protein